VFLKGAGEDFNFFASIEIHKLKTIIEVSIVVSCCFSRWNIRDEDLFGGGD